MSDRNGSLFPPLPRPQDGETLFHYLTGFCKQHTEPGYVRVYPDILAPRFYIVVREKDVRAVRTWSEAERAAVKIAGVDDVPYCTVGLEHGVSVQVVKMWTVKIGGNFIKSLIGATPEILRAESRNYTKGRGDTGPDPGGSRGGGQGGGGRGGGGGGGNDGGSGREPGGSGQGGLDGEGDTATEPTPVTSAF
jgi:hypothetical protein